MDRRPLIIYGNGQMAGLLHQFASLEFEVVAFTVDQCAIRESTLAGKPVVPFETLTQHYPPKGHQFITAVGHIQMNRLRSRKYQEAKAWGYAFANYIHPSVVRHPSVSLGENNVILDHVAIHPFTRIGNGNFICSNASIGHGCTIDDDCLINSGVAIAGETHIHSGCFLGVNATIGDNISLGDHCYVGAHTLIVKDTVSGEVRISPAGERFPLSSDEFLQFIQRARNAPAP